MINVCFMNQTFSVQYWQATISAKIHPADPQITRAAAKQISLGFQLAVIHSLN